MKEIINLKNSNSFISTENINKLITEINKLFITKYMRKLLLIASINLLSSTKTTKGLIYQLTSFQSQNEISPERTKSKYLNRIIDELNNLSPEIFNDQITKLIDYLNKNQITLQL